MYFDGMQFTNDSVFLSSSNDQFALWRAQRGAQGPIQGSPGDIYFKLDRKTGSIEPAAEPPKGAKGVRFASGSFFHTNLQRPDAFVSYVGTSDGTLYSLYDPHCGRIATLGFLLTASCAPAVTSIAPGDAVTSIESVGRFLLVGTVRKIPNSSRVAPGRGVLVLSAKDHSLLTTIDQNHGLPGNLIDVIRRDPITGNVWVETDHALSELSPNLKVLRSFFFHVGIDSKGAPIMLSGRQPEADDPYAELALRLHVTDFSGFQKVEMTIPSPTRGELFKHVFPNGSAATSPVPSAFQPLLPYFIADLQTEDAPWKDEFALASLCKFSGQSVKDTANRLIANAGARHASYVWYVLKDCADEDAAAVYVPSIKTHAVRSAVNSPNRLGADVNRPTLTVVSLSPPIVYWNGRDKVRVEEATSFVGAGVSNPGVTEILASSTFPVDPSNSISVASLAVPVLHTGSSSIGRTEIVLPATSPAGYYYIAACPNAEGTGSKLEEHHQCLVPQREDGSSPN